MNIMYPTLLLTVILYNFVIANELNHTYHGGEHKLSAAENKNSMGIPLWKQHFWKPHKSKVVRNSSYIDKAENMIRFPTLNQQEDIKKKKILKKSPKRTIQKIIKKNRTKTKRIYVIKRPSSTPAPIAYDQRLEDMSMWTENQTTMPINQKKTSKKYYSKLTRNPKPFHILQKQKSYKRERRNIPNRDDFYILKDFDEMKFLKDDKDFSVVKTHVKKYW